MNEENDKCEKCKAFMWADLQCPACGDEVCPEHGCHFSWDGAFYCLECGADIEKQIEDELCEIDYCERYHIESEFTPWYREPQI